MSYLVLARFWRPQKFDEVIGQEHIVTTLKNSIKIGRIGHAYLFTGVRGVGKTTAARILAKALNCEKGITEEPCLACSSCKEIASSTSIDVREIDGASNRGIDSIRELIERVEYKPARDRHKIYIIDEVHMLTMEAFNALLKTLEEPPPYVIFIFATTEPHKIPATIISRCQRFDFRRVPIRLIMEQLKKISSAEGIEISDGALRVIARESEGSMRDSQSLLDQIISFAGRVIDTEQVREVLKVSDRRWFFDLLKSSVDSDVPGALMIVDQADECGISMKQFIHDFAKFLSESLKLKAVGAKWKEESTFTDAEAENILSLLKDLSAEDLARRLNLVVSAANEMADPKHASKLPRLTVEVCMVKLANLGELLPAAEILDRLFSFSKGAVKKKPEHVPEWLTREEKGNIEDTGDRGDTGGAVPVLSRDRSFKSFIESLEKNREPSAAYLRHGRLIRESPDEIVLEYDDSDEGGYFFSMIERHRAHIEGLANGYFAPSAPELRFELKKTAKKLEHAETRREIERVKMEKLHSNEAVRRAVEMFSGEVVEINIK
ncbi:MAG: DNA polymerase III subunit gamma/tau [Deltaproteobacteria bacterium]|nr:DNA polymerase III subunit gamma/tau [Deltaproteobacteria bacterium]